MFFGGGCPPVPHAVRRSVSEGNVFRIVVCSSQSFPFHEENMPAAANVGASKDGNAEPLRRVLCGRALRESRTCPVPFEAVSDESDGSDYEHKKEEAV